MLSLQWTAITYWTSYSKYNKRAKQAPSALPTRCSSLQGRGSRTFFCLASSTAWKILPTFRTIVRATLLSQSKDQNSSHVSREQMSYHLGWCEHRYNADRKLRQSLVEPIMDRAVGAGLQTQLFLCRATWWCMINFLTNSTQAAQSLPSLLMAKLVSRDTAQRHQASRQNKSGLWPKGFIWLFFITDCTSTFFGF